MLNRTTDPSTYLITLTELKAHLGIEHALDDTRLTLLLATSRDQIESDSNLVLTTQVWEQSQRCFQTINYIKKTPFDSLVVKYYDSDNSLQTWDSANYYLVKDSYLAHIEAVDDFPTLYDRPDAITFITTHADKDLPIAKQACLMLAASWNENREAEVTGTISKEISIGYERLIKSIRRGRLF